jgi:hypothetical protein
VIHIALERPRPSEALIWKLLLRGAHVLLDRVNDAGQTPLHMMVTAMPEIIGQILATYPVDTSSTDGEGRTPLTLAVQLSSLKAVNGLLRSGRVSTTLRDSRLRTPFHYVQDPSIAKVLLSGRDALRLISFPDINGETPLHALFLQNGPANVSIAAELARLYREAGANTQVWDFQGRDPLYCAKERWPRHWRLLLQVLCPCDRLDRHIDSITEQFRSKVFNLSKMVDAQTIPALGDLLECPSQ